MSAGTLTLANNSDVVAGIDTSFTTDLSAGDFIVVTTGGVTYTLPVKTIESDTALTLARNYNGPAVTAGAWTAMPRDTLNRISGQMAADTSYAIRQRVLEIDNWYQLLEVNGDVTIKMADGSSYTGPSWLKLIDAMNNPTWALAKSKNLSDLEDRDEAWMNVRPTGPTSLAASPVEDSDAATMGWVKTFVAALRSIASAWSVIVTLASEPANSTTVKGGKLRSVLQIGDNEYAAAELKASVTTSSAGARTVSAEVNVIDMTSGTAASKTIKLGTIDGLTGGTIYGDIISAAGSVEGGYSGIEARNTAADPLGIYFNATMGGYFRGGLEFVNDRDGKYGYSTAISFSRNSGITGDHREPGLRINSDGTTWMVSQPTYGSDERLKGNIEDIGSTRDELRSLRTVYYDMDGRRQIGLIAQDVQKYWPELIDNFEKVMYSESGEKTEGTYLSLNYTGMIAPTIKAVNENSDAIDRLMDIVKEAISTIAGVTTDKSAKAALEALAERIPAPDTQ